MLFLRSKRGAREISLSAMRALTVTSLAAYPLGAITVAWSDSLAGALAGYALVLVAVFCAGVIIDTSLQRIVAEQPALLDEYQLKLRARAMSSAYASLSSIVLVAVIYFAIGSDFGFWVPDSYEEFNGLFWGAFLYATVLPGAILAWQVDAAEIEPEA